MVEENDGIDDAFENQLRMYVIAAAQIAERKARERQEALYRAQVESENEARRLQERLEAEWEAARLELQNVGEDQWWDNAGVSDIGHMYEVAAAWADEKEEAADALEKIHDEVLSRYGVDIDEYEELDGEGLSEELESVLDGENELEEGEEVEDGEGDLDDGENELDDAEQERVLAERERAQAQGLAAEADVNEHLSGIVEDEYFSEFDPAQDDVMTDEIKAYEVARDDLGSESMAVYDSAERRAATAERLEAAGVDSRAIAARMHADVSQAKPATEIPLHDGGARSAGAGRNMARSMGKSKDAGNQL